MSRVIAAYDLDEDNGGLWVNANLKRMPDFIIVANQLMDRAQTVIYVPEARLLEALDENRRVEAGNAKLLESNKKWMGKAARLEAKNAKLRELVREMWNEGAFAPGACYVETDRLEERTRELGVEVDE